jgi:hypothetical protein
MDLQYIPSLGLKAPELLLENCLPGIRFTDMFAEHVAYSPSCYTEKGRASEAIKESRHQHGLHVLGNRARYHPDQKECERADVDESPSIELHHVSWLPVQRHVCNCRRLTSESGLRIIGPAPSPATNNDSPSVHTIRDAPNSGSS